MMNLAKASAIVLVALLIALLPVRNGVAEEQELLTWEELPAVPDELGFAGPFAGVHNDALIVAGGANFPKPVWETEKVWHDRIFVLSRNAGELRWLDGGRLAKPIAYGAAVSTADGVVCMGGNDAENTFDDVFLMQWDPSKKRITRTEYPPLPKPCAFGAAALVGNVVYLAGGQTGQSLENAMTNFWSLDLSKKDNQQEFVWRELTAWPGRSRAFNLTVKQHNGYNDSVYVMSGRRQEGDEIEFLKDTWEYTPTTGKCARERMRHAA